MRAYNTLRILDNSAYNDTKKRNKSHTVARKRLSTDIKTMIITAAKYVKHARLQFGNRYTNIIYKIGMCIREVSNFAYIF